MWGLSIPFWETVFRWATISAFVLGGFTATAAFVSAWVGYELSDIVQKDADRRISEAKMEAARANEASERLRNETARLEADNLSLQKIMQPRRLTPLLWTRHPERISGQLESLKTMFAGTKAFIYTVPDFEAQMFADDITGVLTASGWEVRKVDSEEAHIPERKFREGLYIFTLVDGKTDTQAGGFLSGAIGDITGITPLSTRLPLQPKLPKYPYFDPPVTGVLIIVGVRAISSEMLEIQRRQLEREQQELINALKDGLRKGISTSASLPDGTQAEIVLGADNKLYIKTPTGNVEYTAALPPPRLMIPGSGGPFNVTIPMGQGNPKQ
jgi:hypothetical protein